MVVVVGVVGVVSYVFPVFLFFLLFFGGMERFGVGGRGSSNLPDEATHLSFPVSPVACRVLLR